MTEAAAEAVEEAKEEAAEASEEVTETVEEAAAEATEAVEEVAEEAAETAEEAAEAVEEKAEEVTEAAAEAVALPAEPAFAPNADYDEYTVVVFAAGEDQEDLICTVSRKADDSEFCLECSRNGEDQMARATWDGEKYEVVEDKTGAMTDDIPAILDIAVEQSIWLPIEK